MLNERKGNMYPFVQYTWNPIKGCLHDCAYCYVKALSKRYNFDMTPRLCEDYFKDRLPEHAYIFVGSTSDMFGEWVPSEWISRVLEHCRKFESTYLFQSKNPIRFMEFRREFPAGEFGTNTCLGTTLETNHYPDDGVYSLAPPPEERAITMRRLYRYFPYLMISVEPIMDFDLGEFADLILKCEPRFVVIGADSKRSRLPEPPPNKIIKLIRLLDEFTEVIIKENLRRLIK